MTPDLLLKGVEGGLHGGFMERSMERAEQEQYETGTGRDEMIK
jgi:hypothetical protein